MEDYVSNKIKEYLISIGYRESVAMLSAKEGGCFFTKSCCNSKDAFKECCDFAGKIAQQKQPSIKYKQPKSPTRKRSKKPQEAFNFGGV